MRPQHPSLQREALAFCFILAAFAPLGFGSQSLILKASPHMQGLGALPNTPAYSMTDFRIEMQFDTFASQNENVGLFEIDSDLRIFIGSDNFLYFQGFGQIQTVFIPLGSTNAGRIVAQ